MSLLVGLLVIGCASEQRYSVEGRIVGFADDGRTVIVSHTDVPGFMPRMTMPFRVLSESELAGHSIGEAIRFELVLKQDSSWIESVTRIDSVDVAPITTSSASASGPVGLIVGERVPPTSLINQDGTTRTLFERTEAEIYIIDFIFTRCPMPEFCPLMSRKFRDIQRLLRSDGIDSVQLVSVTVDPEFDTPPVLLEYAQRYEADNSIWNFYTGTRVTLEALYTYFGISLFVGDGQAVVHPQFAALVAGDGTVLRLWRDDDWQPELVVGEVKREQAVR